MLEPYDGKLSSTVLRRERGRKLPDLSGLGRDTICLMIKNGTMINNLPDSPYYYEVKETEFRFWQLLFETSYFMLYKTIVIILLIMLSPIWFSWENDLTSFKLFCIALFASMFINRIKIPVFSIKKGLFKFHLSRKTIYATKFCRRIRD